MRCHPLVLVALLLGAFALVAAGCGELPGGGDGGGDEIEFAPADRAKIRPGVQTAGCTSNFVFTDGDDIYLGQAAHCQSEGESQDTNGCQTRSKPLGTRVRVEGATRPATLAYSSWEAMRRAGEKDRAACEFNDFALLRIDEADQDLVNPSMLKFGGPQGIGTTRDGERVYTYGNSELRLGIDLLSPKTGLTVDVDPSGWSYTVYTLTPGIPGDSGSGMLNQRGQALGVVVTVDLGGRPGSNGITDIRRALDYARRHGMPDVELADGTEKFRPSFLGLN